MQRYETGAIKNIALDKRKTLSNAMFFIALDNVLSLSNAMFFIALDKLKTLSEALKVNPDWIMGWDEEEKSGNT